MDLYKEILTQILEQEEIRICFPNLQLDANKLIESASYQALQKIKLILENDYLEDNECFEQIEQILLVFEHLGSSCKNRHDF
ncbi:hypothetical protein [Chakrabartyella piscis]|uniref:hypothetical protein n=1 Tax=Chakrabartyella piscis TaxID=2918914 RepID=UPI002958AE92|nr:hypothetical protein [Chakrabartyella piscis]